jgi:regulator of protease activity HflC (stomatin/prohibitin superfamily)
MRSITSKVCPKIASRLLPGLALAVVALGATGCATTVVEPGHRGLYFAPNEGGLNREVLQPGKYKLGWCFLYCTPNRIDDFDVTFSTKSEEVQTKSAEGLDMSLKLSVIYRPIVSELYQLETEIGPNYYDEVVAPEFKSACRGVFARHSYKELQKKNEAIENEVEAEVRRRTGGKHVEIASVTLENVVYAPEMAEKIRQQLVAEQENEKQLALIAAERAKSAAEAEREKQLTQSAAAQKQLELQTEAAQKKAETQADAAQKELEINAEANQKQLQLTKEAEEQKLELQKEAENAKFKAQQQLASLELERKGARADLEIGKLRAQAAAQAKLIEGKADAEIAKAQASAHAAERAAETAGVTPMEVMVHAYDALAHLGGNGTTLVMGDWAHVPNFLFPKVPSFQSAFQLPYSPFGGSQIMAPPSQGTGGNVLSSVKGQ